MRPSLLPSLRAVAATLAVVAAPCVADTAGPGLEPVQLQSPHYGDALFHFFQDDFFGTIVRTEAYRSQGLLGPHRDDAELLLGGAYLSFGHHQRAANLFARLLADESTPQSVRDNAWFHLGKVLYARGHDEQAVDALRRAGGSLPAATEAERLQLLAQGLMRLGRFDEAARQLEGIAGPAGWQAFGRFNLGVALVRAGRVDEGLAILDLLGREPADTEEMKALRDKANVAYGYASLQAGRPAAARAALERVRLDGRESTRALLGAGWADVEQDRYAEAIPPWIELRGRSLLDPAVQESYLAVPYAYSRLTAERQAALSYEVAIAAYTGEQRRLRESIDAIRAGSLLTAVLAADDQDYDSWFWQLGKLPDAPESRYLYHLLAGHKFQEALKHYRSLGFLARSLDGWSRDLEAFAQLLVSRRQAQAAVLPAARQRLQQLDLDALKARQEALSLTLVRALNETGTPSLGAGDVLRQLGGLAVVDAGLSTAQPLRDSLQAAVVATPSRMEALAGRVDVLAPRVLDLSARVASARQRQGEYLAALAIVELESQLARLADYEAQARFALAALYDRPAAGSGAGTAP